MTNKTPIIMGLLLLFWMNIKAQETVYIESSEFGRGILKSRPGEHFVVAPLHVVENSSGDVTIVGNRNVISYGEFVQGFPSDLAVIRITGGGSQDAQDWSVHEQYSELIANTIEGFLELRNDVGATLLMQVFFTEKDDEIITIVPKNNSNSFTKGMSGASLFTTNDDKRVYLGMLQEIDQETGEGYVLQADDMDRVLSSFFKTRVNSSQTMQKGKLDNSLINGKFNGSLAILDLDNRIETSSTLNDFLNTKMHQSTNSFFRPLFVEKYKNDIWTNSESILDILSMPINLKCVCLFKEELTYRIGERLGHKFTSVKGTVDMKVFNRRTGETSNIKIQTGGSGANESTAYLSFQENFISELIQNKHISKFESCKK